MGAELGATTPTIILDNLFDEHGILVIRWPVPMEADGHGKYLVAARVAGIGADT